jgi:hypothetical protein
MRALLLRCCAVLLAGSMFAMPFMLNKCGLNRVCDEMGSRTVPVSEEEEVKHACAIGYLLIDRAYLAHVETVTPIPYDERIEATVHGEVAVPPPKAVA